ncbi:unnamed protein product [Paramecium octaurelia]|uniref:Protein kinase domain-containing protein n=1 Tax=Paramecium octaurelia TaxID=43137 RepID=A0A8S1XQZ8_PAROT|nr:unnamed protein product [Paramecium octaurelia]
MLSETTPRKFHDYYKINKNQSLGSGQYGEVYACEKLNNNNDYQKYCVKIIPISFKESIDEKRSDEEMINDVLKSYNQSISFNGPKCMNIVQTFDTFKDQTSLYIVMEQCDEDLDSEFERRKSNEWYSEQEAFEIIRQIISGMKYLYNNKIIHRDIKPENILIKNENPNKIYKIGDFGVGKLVEDILNKSVITKTGSLNYAAPQMIFNEVCTSKCDIFSYGVLFYNICYKGEFPYPSHTRKDLLASLKQLKSKRFIAPSLDFNRAVVIQELLEQMIVYDEAQRCSFQYIFTHKITKTGMEETTQICPSKQLFLPVNKQQLQKKKEKENQIQFLEKIKSLLEVLYDQFKVCNDFVKKIERNQQHTFLSYIIQLVAKYQLEYALAFVFIRPLEFHPVINQNNDIPELVQKLRKNQLILQNNKEDLSKGVLSLQKEIHAAFFKLRTHLFNQINKMLSSTSELSQNERDIIKNSATSKIEISILQDLLRKIKNQQSATLDNGLKEQLDQIINLETEFQKITQRQY